MELSLLLTDHRIERIGSVSDGIDGADEYLLVKRMNDDLDAGELRDAILSLRYCHTDIPGGYFFHYVTVQPLDYQPSAAIVIIHHRYNV